MGRSHDNSIEKVTRPMKLDVTIITGLSTTDWLKIRLEPYDTTPSNNK